MIFIFFAEIQTLLFVIFIYPSINQLQYLKSYDNSLIRYEGWQIFNIKVPEGDTVHTVCSDEDCELLPAVPSEGSWTVWEPLTSWQ